ncbi:MAG: sn-glycerol-3-phosphate ABC transporter ATP-binding protein UgpC [Acidobacteria bacterium]|nr:sn-glycerol-3-phosphate ABC transporter ATP-binding protein UgpC [Acidobacteriota bacterium]
MAEVEVTNLRKDFDDVIAVKDVSFKVHDKEFMVLVGPSGCGKSTTLRMVAGLEEVTAGEIKIGDRVVNDVPPKDRDIAMVFQNYALYPHMSVRDNMAFGLKLRKFKKDEIERRVSETAEILEITELLERKPKALSGGQRQRVAMGRAIVREPVAFLMDEPLSNLDAKLRIQMRAELERLSARLGTTTVYVTHDQVEAMTLGDRVAVLRTVSAARPYNLQQVGPPTELFESPVNLFVAGFIGSPAMNLLYGILENRGQEVWLKAGEYEIRVDPRSIDAHPGIENRMGDELVVGIRPNSLEAAAVAGPDDERTIRVEVEATEMLGAETFVHFSGKWPPVITPDIEELLADTGQSASSLGETSSFIARVSPDVRVRRGESIDLIVDTTKLHFFDSSTGDRIGAKQPAALGALSQ